MHSKIYGYHGIELTLATEWACIVLLRLGDVEICVTLRGMGRHWSRSSITVGLLLSCLEHVLLVERGESYLGWGVLQVQEECG